MFSWNSSKTVKILEILVRRVHSIFKNPQTSRHNSKRRLNKIPKTRTKKRRDNRIICIWTGNTVTKENFLKYNDKFVVYIFNGVYCITL